MIPPSRTGSNIPRIALACALLSASSAGVAQTPCQEATPCQLAGVLLQHTLERFPLEGRALFVDVESFRRMALSLAGDLSQNELATTVRQPFRTDVDNTQRTRPSAGFTPRWANDPLVISVDSARVRNGEVHIILRQRYNVRNPNHPEASAVFAEISRWEYVVRREGTEWRIVSSRRLTRPF